MNSEAIVIEVCVSEEFLDCDRDVVCEFFNTFERLCDSIRANIEVVPASGKRARYHGWNGAQFTRRTFGIGTWAQMTESLWSEIGDAAYEARIVAGL